MFCKVYSGAIKGVEIEPVSVETDVSDGLPVFDMVGLLGNEVREAKERVRTAIKNSGFSLMPKRITVNLSPADVRKEGTGFDLPIAVGILLAMNFGTAVLDMEKTMFAGELSLDGKVRGVRGILPLILEGEKRGFSVFLVPGDNVLEGSIAEGVTVIGVTTLRQVWEIVTGKQQANPVKTNPEELYQRAEWKCRFDFAEIQGQTQAKFAAEIAAAGRHNLLMTGPPGTGKSLIASCIPGILPKPDLEECIEITKIQSIAGILGKKLMVTERPFRAPHNSVTQKALIGGGRQVRPGEITLAHRGVLFLDEFAEFKREVIDALRQPLEQKEIVISRVYGTEVFPADFMLVAAMNPCRCGYYPDRNKCTCSEAEVFKYRSRISGPIFDRMDLCVGMTPLKAGELQSDTKAETSEKIRKRVEAAAAIQKERYRNEIITCNAQLNRELIKKYCHPGEKERKLLAQVYEKFELSARTYYKIMKVARTIADLRGKTEIGEEDLATAIGYRISMKEGGHRG